MTLIATLLIQGMFQADGILLTIQSIVIHGVFLELVFLGSREAIRE